MHETQDLGSIPGLGRSQGSRILAWKIPWTEEPGGLQSMGSQKTGHDLATKQQHTDTYFKSMINSGFNGSTLLEKYIGFILPACTFGLALKAILSHA